MFSRKTLEVCVVAGLLEDWSIKPSIADVSKLIESKLSTIDYESKFMLWGM
jgi:hypothetical protein